MKFALVGYGRMGHAIERQAVARGHELAATLDAGAMDTAGPGSFDGVDVALEFTRPEAAGGNVLRLLQCGIPVVCGTTGWTPGASVERAARERGVGAVIAPNFSVGMNLFYRLAREAARLFGEAGLHQPYLLEAHHRAKRDVPSGTSRRLAQIVIAQDPRLTGVHEGNPSEPLPPDQLHVASIRAGSEPGTHVLGFDGEHDAVLLKHSARGRAGFALGAVMAAEWVRERGGLHDFEPVLDALLESGSGSEV